MKLSFNKFSLVLLSLAMLLSDSCTHKNLNDDAPTTIADNVEVIFDWSKAPDTEASTMNLYLYSDRHEVMNHWFNNNKGGTIKSYSGPHTAVCHSNDDPYNHHLRNQHSHDEIEIYTEETAVLVGQGISTRGIPRAEGTDDEPLRVTPSMIYGAQEREIDFKVSGLPQTLTLYPEELVSHYTVEIVDVENVQNADLRIDATISSLAGSYYPGQMRASSEPVSHPFTLVADIEKKTLHSEFLTFGVPDGTPRPHMVCLYIALKNKTGNFYTFDVSDQVNSAPDPKNVYIKIYGLKLPDIPDEPPVPSEEGGVSIEVDTWDTIHFDLKV
ncbi:MAG: DUF5119 domain-containing protein [Muribaculaceae bacterium]|nr:DUF5119 domain-containing protein [Muribaculaceae bacterium]